jgi:hypothetical protein
VTRRRYLGLAVTTVVALPALLALGGCDDDGTGFIQTCTLIGCDSGVTVHLTEATRERGPLTIRLCVDGECTEQSADRGRGTAIVGVYREPERWEPGERVRVEATVATEEGEVVAAADEVVELRRVQPNGRDCPPTCAQARVDL